MTQTWLCQQVNDIEDRLLQVELLLSRLNMGVGTGGKLLGTTWEVSENQIAQWVAGTTLPLGSSSQYARFKNGSLEIRGGRLDIHTGESGAHMTLDGEDLYAYDSGGNNTVHLDWSTGGIWAKYGGFGGTEGSPAVALNADGTVTLVSVSTASGSGWLGSTGINLANTADGAAYFKFVDNAASPTYTYGRMQMYLTLANTSTYILDALGVGTGNKASVLLRATNADATQAQFQLHAGAAIHIQDSSSTKLLEMDTDGNTYIRGKAKGSGTTGQVELKAENSGGNIVQVYLAYTNGLRFTSNTVQLLQAYIDGSNNDQLTWGRASGSASCRFDLNGPAGTHKSIYWESGSSRRWGWRCNSTAESGSNAGSDLELLAFSDAGNPNITVLTATRSSGKITMNRAMQFDSDIGFFGTTPVSKTSVSDQSAWAAVSAGSDSVDLSDLNTKVKAIRDKLQEVLDGLQVLGLM